jgi:zinc transporter, ZIP family
MLLKWGDNMSNTLRIVILSGLVSLIGTMVGASIGVLVSKPTEKLMGAILGFAGGLMLSIVVFDLIPESIETWSFSGTLFFCILGIILTIIVDNILTVKNHKLSSHSKVAFMTALGLMLHNLPEGIIMGCGFIAGRTMGLKMSIIIAIHDIPEGLAVAAPLMVSKVRISKIMFYVFITALPTALGAWIGIFAGRISPDTLGACLAIASGIMLYVVCGELLPESTKVWDGITSTLGVLAGVIAGLIMINLL